MLVEVITASKPGTSGPAGLRPISMLQTSMKALETLLYRRFLPEVIHALPPTQFAFRRNLNTEMLLMDLFSRIGAALEAGEHCLLSCLDIEGAYDAVHFSLMLDMLVSLNACPSIVRVVRSWLYRRRLRAKVRAGRTALSSDFPAQCGLPQGGILSPLLWALYISDIHLHLSSDPDESPDATTRAFADDLTALHTGVAPAATARLHRRHIASLTSYFRRMRLSVSAAKSACLWLSPQLAGHQVPMRRSPKALTPVYCGGKSWHTPTQARPPSTPFPPPPCDEVCFPVVPVVRLLGVHLDADFSFAHHVSMLKANLQRRLAII